jgi:hypothetical protein
MTMSANASLPDAKQIFEAAMMVLDDNSPTAESAQLILQRKRALRTRAEDADSQEKRTLAEAADALSKLWRR